MHPRTAFALAAAVGLAAVLMLAAPASAVAQSAPAPVASAPPAVARAPAPLLRADDPASEPASRGEPDVHHNVFEDGGSKIDELVVRGEVQHVVVTPKVGTTRSYEIIVQRGGRTPPDSAGGAMSAVGKRVWNVLAF